MSSDVVQQIKDRLSIVDVVSSYVKLTPAGKNFKAKSPFSNERTPSFYVSPERGMYYCFSTNQGGDIFTFVQKLEGVDFKGALTLLAERAGVTLTPHRREDADAEGRLYDALETATAFFEAELGKRAEALEYLRSRSVAPATQTLFRLGFAPAGWSRTREYLAARGIRDADMERAGLIKRSETGPGYYDRFRGRLMFPLCDTTGRVIAFSGRILPLASNPEYKEDVAKYINSPETPLYSKSRALYGYSLAKNAIRKFNCSILVEGQLDLVLSHQAGYGNTVAVSGTALTEEQLSLLARLSNNLVMAFDADRAGVNSAGKGIALALSRGMDVKVAALPKGSDPADLVRSGAEHWKAVVRSAKHVVDFYLDYLAQEYAADPRRLKLAVSETVIPFIAEIPNRIDQAHFVTRVAERLKTSEEPVWDEVRKRMRAGARTVPQPGARAEEMNPEARFPRQGIEERLAAILLWQERLPEDDRTLPVGPLEEQLRASLGAERLTELMDALKKEENKILFEAELFYYAGTRELTADVDELLANLAKVSRREAYETALSALRAAERAGDDAAVAKWLTECSRLSAEEKPRTSKMEGAG